MQYSMIREWMSLFERCVSIVAGTPSSSTLQLEESTPLVSISAATSTNSQRCLRHGMVWHGMVFPEQLRQQLVSLAQCTQPISTYGGREVHLVQQRLTHRHEPRLSLSTGCGVRIRQKLYCIKDY